MRAALLRAYEATVYRAAGTEVRIGRRCPAMDELLHAHGTREAVFLTAWNPYSRRMPAGWNQRMQTRLALAIRQRGAIASAGAWRRWSEAHFLVFGEMAPMRHLARRFRQNAIVFVILGQRARLVVLRRSTDPDGT